MATMSLNALIDHIYEMLENQDLGDEGIGSVLISVGNQFGLAVTCFTPAEMGDAVNIEQLEDHMITAGNTLIGDNTGS